VSCLLALSSPTTLLLLGLPLAHEDLRVPLGDGLFLARGFVELIAGCGVGCSLGVRQDADSVQWILLA